MAFGQEVKDFISAFSTGANVGQRAQQRDLQQQGIDIQRQKTDLDQQMLTAQLGYLKAKQDYIKNMPIGTQPDAYTAGANAAGNAAKTKFDASSPQAQEIKKAATVVGQQLGVDPRDIVTAMSYETGGTLNPWQAGPADQYGAPRRGLIQMGTNERNQYKVTPQMSAYDQTMAVGQYLKDRGVRPGMGLMDIYSAINAGHVGRYGASDAANGGAPGTVADKVNNQMGPHMANAMALFSNPGAVAAIPTAQYSAPAQSAIPVSDDDTD